MHFIRYLPKEVFSKTDRGIDSTGRGGGGGWATGNENDKSSRYTLYLRQPFEPDVLRTLLLERRDLDIIHICICAGFHLCT